MNADRPKVHERRTVYTIAFIEQRQLTPCGSASTPPWAQDSKNTATNTSSSERSCHQKKGHTLIFHRLRGSFYLPDSADPITLDQGPSGLRPFPIIWFHQTFKWLSITIIQEYIPTFHPQRWWFPTVLQILIMLWIVRNSISAVFAIASNVFSAWCKMGLF